MGFTAEQIQAIESRKEDLLVSAAAGSGKTTVLVERIIRRILDDNEPVDIDRLLVMTFTKAAAEQMKEKILKAIDEKRSLDPLNKHLIKQSALVHNARISTIHGFCLDVIRNHFQEIGMDPDFRVADEAECRLLKRDVLDIVIEEAYEEGDEGFLNMTECLSGGKNDTVLEDILDKLYDFSMSDPDPEDWLRRCEEIYSEPLQNMEWLRIIVDNAFHIIEDAYDRALTAQGLCGMADGPELYEQVSEQDIGYLKELIEAASGDPADTYRRLQTLLQQLKWQTLPRGGKNTPYIDPELKEKYRQLRDGYKKDLSELAKNEFALTLEEHINRIHSCVPVVSSLTELTRRVMVKYSEAKKKKKIADFNDLEHMCIGILSAKDGNTAREYREYFEEIYVDEYQDSNLVQEELLKHISRGNNLFMVGDVKQSIYSFRLARPQLFMDKYNTARVCSDSSAAGLMKEDKEERDSDRTDKNASPEYNGLRRIDLTYNFRSRSSVLASVNELFVQIMSKDMGGITYDEAASLHPGAYYPYADELQEKTELMLVMKEPGISDRELEAKTVAARIKRLMNEQRVYDPTENEPDRTRPVKYSDVAVLLRSAKGWDETFEKVLSAEGIPVQTMSRTGYFTAREVSVLLDYLRVLDNPLQDIPMAAVLMSVIGRFSDEELAMLRVNYPGRYLYDSIRSCAVEHGTPDENRKPGQIIETGNGIDVVLINRKCTVFLEKYDRLRERTAYLPVYEILLELVDGEYGDCVSAMPDGKRRKANLNMLLKRAEDYGKTSYKGLFHFVRYIETLKKYEVDYGEAGTADVNDDTVRIMTIHKSKGLEFPVCIIAGMHKKYNLMDSRAAVIPDIDLGLGIDKADPDRRIRLTTAVKRAVSRKKLYETLAEEERVLYVAMTRAKEKLIMTGIVNDIEKILATDKGVIKCTSYLELVLHGLNNAGLPSVTVNTVTAEGMIESEIRETVNYEAAKEELRRIAREAEGRKILSEARDCSEDNNDGTGRTDTVCRIDKTGGMDETGKILQSRFAFIYPYENERRQFEKVSVTELKRRSMHETEAENIELPDASVNIGEYELAGLIEREAGWKEETGERIRKDISKKEKSREDESGARESEKEKSKKEIQPGDENAPYIPDFIRKTDKEVPATLHGTAVHRVFEIWDYNRDTSDEDIKGFMEYVRTEGLMEEDLAGCVKLGEVSDFVNSPLAGRMKKAFMKGLLYREQPFMFSFDGLLIQGIIDAYFIEDDKIVIVDYKTDRVDAAEELADRYHVQLEYYARALSVMTGMEVSELIIYSTRHKCTVNIQWPVI